MAGIQKLFSDIDLT